MAITKITTPELFNLQSNNTEGTQLPVMTTTEREAITGMSNGELIFNSTTDSVEYYDAGAAAWYKIDYKVDPLENFNTVLYTGDGSTSGQSITSVGFQPDLVWIKTMNQNTKHLLTDSVKGVNSQIFSNEITSQQNYNEFDSFDPTGFTVSRNTGTDYFNQSTIKYVAWCFKAGGAAVANTNGDLASQVSVNNNLGFSIVKGSGNSTGVQTVGHGLDAAPEMIIIKNIAVNDNWWVYHSAIGVSQYLQLNTTSTPLNWSSNMIVNSTAIGVRQNSTGPWGNLIAYCFTSKPGISKIGSYTGNGINNPVDVGFEPAFVMIKNTTSSASWAMFDNKRTTANPSTSALYANEAIFEEALQLYFQFTSTGFKNLQSSNTLNTSGSIYIYLAFA